MRSLRGRVALAALAATALVVVISCAALFATAGRDERNDLDDRLEGETNALAGLGPFVVELRELTSDRLPPAAREVARRVEGLVAGSGRVVRVLRGGRPVAELGDVPEGARFPAGPADGLGTLEVQGESWRAYGAPAGAGVTVQVLASAEGIEDRAAGRRRTTALLGAGALALSAVLGLLFGRLATRPLARLRDAAARVRSTEDLGERVPAADGPEEVESLAHSLNSMLARLERSAAETEAALAASRRFAADAGHELRTPLTGLRMNVDALARNADMPADDRRRLAAGVRAELDRLAGTLDALQHLARGDAGAFAPFEAVDLAELADASAAAVRVRHPGLRLELHAPDEGVRMSGSPTGLRLLLDNLIANAARHGGGRVRVAVEPGVRVVVEDDGPGIAPSERERIFERFYRGAAARDGGSGLGLAIAAQQARLHGGALRVEESPLGGARLMAELRA